MAQIEEKPLALLLTVVADVNPGCDLFRDYPLERIATGRVERVDVNRLAARTADIELGQGRRPG
jgi:hypothetical protein